MPQSSAGVWDSNDARHRSLLSRLRIGAQLASRWQSRDHRKRFRRLKRVAQPKQWRQLLEDSDNLANQGNPAAVENTIGSPQYLQFLGQEGRHYVVRIRFFGPAGTK